MILLIGLLCLDPTKTSTCQTYRWVEKFETKDQCEAMGMRNLGALTPYGVVTAYLCEPMEEDA